jgi:hypothetical protein
MVTLPIMAELKVCHSAGILNKWVTFRYLSAPPLSWIIIYMCIYIYIERDNIYVFVYIYTYTIYIYYIYTHVCVYSIYIPRWSMC